MKCEICQSPDVRFYSRLLSGSPFKYTNGRNLNLYRCVECGYERNLDVKNEDDAISMQSHFDTQTDYDSRSVFRLISRERQISNIINKFIRKGSVLDIGCNKGDYLLSLNGEWNLEGIELSAPLARIAERRTAGIVHAKPIEDFKSETQYNLITSYAVIEHLYSPESFVRKCCEFLTIGGYLVLMTGDRTSRQALSMGDCWPLYFSPDHVSFFSSDSIRYLLAINNMEICDEYWAFNYFDNGVGNRFSRAVWRLLDYMRLLPKNYYDTYYVLARKKG